MHFLYFTWKIKACIQGTNTVSCVRQAHTFTYSVSTVALALQISDVFFWLILIPFVERLDMDMDMDKKRRNEAQARTTERDGEKSKAVSVACNILHHVS